MQSRRNDVLPASVLKPAAVVADGQATAEPVRRPALDSHHEPRRGPDLDDRRTEATVVRARLRPEKGTTTERELHLAALVARERAARTDLEQQLARATSALADLQQRHEAATAKAAEELAQRQAQYDLAVARAAATWEMVEEQLRAAAREVDRARQQQAAATAEAERLLRRELELAECLADATATRLSLERQLDAAAARDAEVADTQAAHERAAVEQLAEQQRELQTLIAQEANQRHVWEEKLAQAVSASVEAEERRTAAMRDADAQLRDLEEALSATQRDLQSRDADVERLTKREADLSSQVASVATCRNDLESRLAAAEAALEQAEKRAEGERLEAITKADVREAALEEQVRHERAAREALEHAVAETKSVLSAAQEHHAAALTAAATDFAERYARVTSELSRVAADRDGLMRQLDEAKAALDQSAGNHQSAVDEVDRLSRQGADLAARLADMTANCDTLERQLAAREAAFEHADAHATRDRLAASKRAAEREAQLDAEIRQERTTRIALEQALADANAAVVDARQRLDAEVARAAGELAERQAAFDRELSQTVADREGVRQRLSEAEAALDRVRRDYQSAAADVNRLAQRESDLSSQLAAAQAAHLVVEGKLAEAVWQTKEAGERAARQQVEAENCQAELEDKLASEIQARKRVEQDRIECDAHIERLSRELTETTCLLEDVRRARNDDLRRLVEHANALAALEAALAERDGKLRDQAAHHEAALQASEQARTGERALMEMELAELNKQLDASRADSHRLFQHAELGMFRCTPDGGLVQANRACMSLVGHREIDKLRGAHFAAAVFDTPDALAWLIERCLSTGSKESIETTWRRKGGSLLFVNVTACPTAYGLIEFVVENLTRLRVLEERLGHAERMEAVGRLASEVAATCRSLLGNVDRSGREWLVTTGCDDAFRRRGEQLLHDVARATELLRQLAVCGEERPRTPMLVDLSTLIRDLEPVLKRVAGENVDVQLREMPSPLNVDVGTERVERVLVNLASYGRERMPGGGRLKIELSTIVVDRHFVTKHPNVRLGPHALITVTKSRRAASLGEERPAGESVASRGSHAKGLPKSGLDIGPLHEIVSECGGHLWMTVQPLGEMVAKIRLPLSTSRAQTLARVLGRPTHPARRHAPQLSAHE